MLTLVSRDIRKAASAVVAVLIVSIGLLVLDQGHLTAVSEADADGVLMAATEGEPAIVSLPEVVVVAQRPGACVTPPSRTSSPYPRCAW
jgi:hypothetical protein